MMNYSFETRPLQNTSEKCRWKKNELEWNGRIRTARNERKKTKKENKNAEGRENESPLATANKRFVESSCTLSTQMKSGDNKRNNIF
jgi:hypothetical protein